MHCCEDNHSSNKKREPDNRSSKARMKSQDSLLHNTPKRSTTEKTAMQCYSLNDDVDFGIDDTCSSSSSSSLECLLKKKTHLLWSKMQMIFHCAQLHNRLLSKTKMISHCIKFHHCLPSK